MHRLPECPAPNELREAFSALDTLGYSATSRLPLFTARHWSPARERRAFQRFRAGECNIEEVAVPRWYWRRLSPSLHDLFRQLTLGHRRPGSPSPPALQALWDGPLPRWRLLSRFGRYVLHSRPEIQDDSLVYFGDDTLFLMAGARRLLGFLQGPPLRVLDLCCGGGGVGLGLSVFPGELVGVDIHQPAIQLAELAARAQGLTNYSYVCSEATSVLDSRYDLIVGNPPTLSPELGGRSTLYATGPASHFLELLSRLVEALTPRGRALLTVFSRALGRGAQAEDPLRRDLAGLLNGRRSYRYSVRRQFPLEGGAWLRHVALEIFPHDDATGESFESPADQGLQLPALTWRRGP